MRILCLLDSEVKPGDRWIWNYLPGNQDEVDFLCTSSQDRFKKWGKLLAYYPAYWDLALRAYRQTRRKKYDIVVAWEGKNGFPYAVLRSLFRQSSPPFAILSFTYRGLVRHFPPLARFALKSVDHLTVTTHYELDSYPRLLSIPPERISLLLLGWYDTLQVDPTQVQPPAERFILAAGRSYRDYATLVRAMDGLDVRLVIVARKFNLSGIREFPANVETRDFMPQPDLWRLLHQAEFLLVPLEPVPHSSGDIHLVQAMSAGKAVIATATASALTYVEDGVTGLLVPPGDVETLREKIQYLLAHPAEAVRMGKTARLRYETCYTFNAMARNINQILSGVSHEK